LGTLLTIQDSLSIIFVEKPFTLALNDIPIKIDSTKNDILFDSSLSEIAVNYPAGGMKLKYTIDCPFYLFQSELER